MKPITMVVAGELPYAVERSLEALAGSGAVEETIALVPPETGEVPDALAGVPCEGWTTGEPGGAEVDARLLERARTPYLLQVSPGAGNTFDYNLWFPNVSFSGRGSHAVAVDPLLENPGGGDCHLAAGSPAKDAGVDIGVSTDRDGNARPAHGAPDIGAYEVIAGIQAEAGDTYKEEMMSENEWTTEKQQGFLEVLGLIGFQYNATFNRWEGVKNGEMVLVPPFDKVEALGFLLKWAVPEVIKKIYLYEMVWDYSYEKELWTIEIYYFTKTGNKEADNYCMCGKGENKDPAQALAEAIEKALGIGE